MSRRTAVLVTATLLAAGSTVPAFAAKPKPKPIKGSYAVTLVPDPVPQVTAQAGTSGCNPYVAQLKDTHAFTVPAAGKLSVVLDSQDPSKGAAPVGLDWDLYVFDATGEAGSSHGGTAHEEVDLSLKKKTPLTFVVCNVGGAPQATVTYTFTYK